MRSVSFKTPFAKPFNSKTTFIRIQTENGFGVIGITRSYAIGSKPAETKEKKVEPPVPLLVTPQWLQENIRYGKIRVIDASWAFGRKSREDFVQKRIPTSQFFDIDEVADTTTTDLPHMLPKPIPYEKAMEAIGVTHKDHVIIYDRSGEYVASARCWWTLKTFGHQKVSILEGGLGAWIRNNGQIETGPVPPPRPRLTSRGRYKSRFNKDLIVNLREVSHLTDGKGQIVDGRSAGRFNSTEPEPRPGVKSGNIPGSINIPYGEILTPLNGGPEKTFLPPDNILEIFKSKNINTDERVITSCGSGVTACVLLMGLHHAGKNKYALYDGSWTEFSRTLK